MVYFGGSGFVLCLLCSIFKHFCCLNLSGKYPIIPCWPCNTYPRYQNDFLSQTEVKLFSRAFFEFPRNQGRSKIDKRVKPKHKYNIAFLSTVTVKMLIKGRKSKKLNYIFYLFSCRFLSRFLLTSTQTNMKSNKVE